MSIKLNFMLGVFLILVLPSAQAYVGPGLGAGTIGVVLGIIGSIVVALFGVLYYPIKRWVKAHRKTEKPDAEPQDESLEGEV